jgi:hypothetical protein
MVRSAVFSSIDLEITNHCSHRCVVCPRAALRRRRGMMSESVFAGILSCLQPAQHWFSVSGFGDPLLHPKVYDFIATLTRLGSPPLVFVNPGSLTPGNIERLVASAPGGINISMHSLRPEAFAALMPHIPFDEALGAAFELIARATSNGIEVQVGGIATRFNEDEGPSFRRFWGERGLWSNWTDCHGRGGNLVTPRVYRPTPATTGLHGRPCGLFSFHSFVTWEGVVLACSNDLAGETALGDLVSDGLESLIARKERVLRDGKFFPLCGACDDGMRFLSAVPHAPELPSRQALLAFVHECWAVGPSE